MVVLFAPNVYIIYYQSMSNVFFVLICPYIGKYNEELSHAKSNTAVLEQEDPFLNLEVDVLNETLTDDNDDLV